MSDSLRNKGARPAVAVLAIMAVFGGALGVAHVTVVPGKANAETHETGGPKGPGAGGHEDGSHEDGGHEDGGHEDGGHEGGSGGHGGGSDGGSSGGYQYGGGSGQGSGGQQAGGGPVWSREGIPEVELGRLNVIRSPDRVLERALAEALASLNGDMVAFYSLPIDSIIMKLSTEFGSVTFIDSPLQNLALFGDLLGGSTALASAGISNSTTDLLAVFLGTASDKEIPISVATAQAVTKILGYNLNDAQLAKLAQKAEAVRIAILAGHG